MRTLHQPFSTIWIYCHERAELPKRSNHNMMNVMPSANISTGFIPKCQHATAKTPTKSHNNFNTNKFQMYTNKCDDASVRLFWLCWCLFAGFAYAFVSSVCQQYCAVLNTFSIALALTIVEWLCDCLRRSLLSHSLNNIHMLVQSLLQIRVHSTYLTSNEKYFSSDFDDYY